MSFPVKIRCYEGEGLTDGCKVVARITSTGEHFVLGLGSDFAEAFKDALEVAIGEEITAVEAARDFYVLRTEVSV